MEKVLQAVYCSCWQWYCLKWDQNRSTLPKCKVQVGPRLLILRSLCQILGLKLLKHLWAEIYTSLICCSMFQKGEVSKLTPISLQHNKHGHLQSSRNSMRYWCQIKQLVYKTSSFSFHSQLSMEAQKWQIMYNKINILHSRFSFFIKNVFVCKKVQIKLKTLLFNMQCSTTLPYKQ